MTTAVLTHEGVTMPCRTLRKILGPRYGDFLAKLTIRYKPKIGPEKVTRLYTTNTVSVTLPRFVGRTLLQHGIIGAIENRLPPAPGVNIAFEGELYPNQEIIVNHLMDRVYDEGVRASGFAGCTLNLQAGQGKTFVAAAIIGRLSVRTLYVSPNVYLAEQAAKDLASCFPRAKVAVWSNKHPDVVADIVIVVINTAIKKSVDFFRQFGLTIFDEPQMYCGKVRSSIFRLAQTQYMLGLSATTDNHRGGLDVIYHKSVGNVIHALDIPGYTPDDAKFTGHVSVIKYGGPPEYTQRIISEATGYTFTPEMLKQLESDPYRNKLIVDEALRLYRDPRMNIFIFSENRQHLDTLRGLILAELQNDVDVWAPELENTAKILRGGIKAHEKKRALESRIILTTYGYSGTGTSIIKMNAAIYATPRRANYIQICARILRKGSDINITRQIVDIVDVETSLSSQLSDRKLAYRHYGFTMSTKYVRHREDEAVGFDE